MVGRMTRRPPEFFVGVYVNFSPLKPATALQLRQALFDDLAKMAAFPRVDDDISRGRHAPDFTDSEFTTPVGRQL